MTTTAWERARAAANCRHVSFLARTMCANCAYAAIVAAESEAREAAIEEIAAFLDAGGVPHVDNVDASNAAEAIRARAARFATPRPLVIDGVEWSADHVEAAVRFALAQGWQHAVIAAAPSPPKGKTP